MNDRKSNPPRRAIWFLQNACPGGNEALTGDLIEKFREGQTRGWFWRQVLIAFAVGVLGKIRRHWPQFSYAIAGTAIAPFLLEDAMHLARAITHRWVQPFSMVTDLIPDALVALAALPALAVTLALSGTFRWTSLLRTWVISISLFAVNLYVVVSVTDLIASGPITLTPVLFISLYLFILFVSAWLGCRSARHAGELAGPAKS
jgi:hypothetical protein